MIYTLTFSLGKNERKEKGKHVTCFLNVSFLLIHSLEVQIYILNMEKVF